MAEATPEVAHDELASAQEQLARALGRARIGEDRNLAGQVRELGERVAHLLAGLLRMTRMHSPNNSAFDKPVDELRRSLARLHELLGTIHLVAVEDQVYVNEVRIRSDDKVTSLRELSAELHRHNAGGITLHAPLAGAAIRALIGALAGAPAAADPRSALARSLAAAGLSTVDLEGRFRFRMAGEAVREQAVPRDLVRRGIAAIDEEYRNLTAGRGPNPLPLRRLVAEVLERGLAAEALWSDLTEGSPFARHQLRVALLALLVGEAVTLPSSVTQDLGVAALYHDCGYARPGGGVSFHEHPSEGARLLLRQKGFHEAKMRRLLAVLQHHRDAAPKPRPGLLGRILRIAEDYDTLTRREKRVSPTLALAAMTKWAGTRYDPALLQLFVNALGAYPPGTFVRLSDQRVFRVCAPARTHEAFAHPLARCVRQADGSPAPDDVAPMPLLEVGPLEVLRPGR